MASCRSEEKKRHKRYSHLARPRSIQISLLHRAAQLSQFDARGLQHQVSIDFLVAMRRQECGMQGNVMDAPAGQLHSRQAIEVQPALGRARWKYLRPERPGLGWPWKRKIDHEADAPQKC